MEQHATPRTVDPDRSSRLAVVGPVTDVVFRQVARLRRARAFHPRGTAFRATAHIPAESLRPPGLPAGDHRAVVRFSKGLGLPDPVPDVLGIGLRILDAAGPGRHQDLLLASSWDSPIGRRLLRPGRSFTSGAFSTLLPYEAGGERIVFGARILGGSPDLDELRRLEGTPGGTHVGVVLYWATLLGPWRPLGTVSLDGPLGAEEERALDLDPFHTAPSLVPAGWLNDLRRPAYAASQAGRGESQPPPARHGRATGT